MGKHNVWGGPFLRFVKMNGKHLYFGILLATLVSGCAVRDVTIVVVDQPSGKSLTNAHVTMRHHEYSLLNSKGMIEDEPVAAGSNGLLVIKKPEKRATAIVGAPGYHNAYVGFSDPKVLRIYSPMPKGDEAFPVGIQQDRKDTVVIPLFPK